jgi:hypothetical protein
MNKSILIAPVIALILAAVTTSIASRAYADDPSYTQGYNVAKFDFLHNRAYDDSCSPNNGDAFCAGYKVGYYAGWHAADLLYGHQVPHQ